MILRPALCLVFLSALGGGVATAAPPPAELVPSLMPFVRAKNQMPDPTGIKFYARFPRADGTYLDRFAHSGEVMHWSKGLERELPEWADQRLKLDELLTDYQDIVKVDGAELLEALDATTEAQLVALYRNDNRLMTLLREYRTLSDQKAAVTAELAAARSKVEAAIEQARAAARAADVQVMEDEQASLSAQREAIVARARDAGFVQRALKTMTDVVGALKSPESLAAYAGQMIAGAADVMLMEAVLQSEWRTLNEIDLREQELREALPAAKNEAVRATLKAAEKNLDAARSTLIAGSIRRAIHAADAWWRIDELALIEKARPRIRLFRPLQAYNVEVARAARTIRDTGEQYLFDLGKGPSGQAARLLAGIEYDIKDVRGRGGDQFDDWLDLADGTRLYVASHAAWYGKERKEVERLIAAAEAGAHLDLVKVVVDRTAVLLGKTVQP